MSLSRFEQGVFFSPGQRIHAEYKCQMRRMSQFGQDFDFDARAK
jgi:hypothetical protein